MAKTPEQLIKKIQELEAEEDNYEIPNEITTDIVLGDLFEIGEHRLLCGDSTDINKVELLINGKEVNLLTDPPYGINANKQTLGTGKKNFHRGDNWDIKVPDFYYILELVNYAIIWGGNYFADKLPINNDWLCWHKKNDGLSFSEFELAWTNLGKNCRMLSHHWGGDAGWSRSQAIMEDFNNDERSVMDETQIRGIDGIYPVTPLQNHLYEVLESTVETFGQFDQGIGAQGAHYVGADENPFAEEGMVCSNCAFYEGPRACELVEGDIDPGGICKFWVIPETLLTIETPAELIVEEEPMIEMESARSTETRSDLYRNVPFEIRATEDTGDGLTLTGYAAVFNRSTMIDNYEGRFEERIRPGAFKRSINAKMPVLQFEHGRHPLLGSMPLGQITKLREDEHGLYVEARLADNWLIQPVRDAIASGAIDGMSFRFQVVRESIQDGETPVRTLEEVKLLELGPVVFQTRCDVRVQKRCIQLSQCSSECLCLQLVINARTDDIPHINLLSFFDC